MTFDLLAGLLLFSFVSSITPGPNNMMLMASGANYGIWRSLPHLLGVAGGFTVMIVGVGLGLTAVFDAYPLIYQLLKIASLLYLLVLAYRLARSAAPIDKKQATRPMTFVQAALFQWVNPKAWAMALTAITIYTWDPGPWAVSVVALIFGAVNLPCILVWAVIGVNIRRFLNTQARLRLFNITMAILLVVSTVPVILAG
jgi:threonine/homoserine/homoserine lactone efflux protein